MMRCVAAAPRRDDERAVGRFCCGVAPLHATPVDTPLFNHLLAAPAQDYERAVATLEPLQLTPETEAQWTQLAEAALATNQLVIAERCFAALGDIAATRFLHKVRPTRYC
jgi:hypothetical protein